MSKWDELKKMAAQREAIDTKQVDGFTAFVTKLANSLADYLGMPKDRMAYCKLGRSVDRWPITQRGPLVSFEKTANNFGLSVPLDDGGEKYMDLSFMAFPEGNDGKHFKLWCSNFAKVSQTHGHSEKVTISTDQADLTPRAGAPNS